MSLPLPDPNLGVEPQAPVPQNPWRLVDLVVFGVFFLFTVLLLNVIVIKFWGKEPTAMAQVVLQILMDGMLVGFIAFLIKVVHAQSFLQAIHWTRNHQFSKGFLISLGVTLAISVLIVSSLFPAGVPLIFVVGYVLSLVRWRSNSLIPSFIIHTSYNAMLFGIFALSTFVQKGGK